MDCLRIRGGLPLHGTVEISGAKNAALPIMAASLLADGPVRLARIPSLRDVALLRQVLHQLGLHTERLAADELVVDAFDHTATRASFGLVRSMRASFCVLGPLLARRGRAEVALPGGCRIGHRPVDLHLKGLEKLGAELRLRRGYVVGSANRLRGADVDLRGPQGSTVTGTANVMSAATLARGRTVIKCAAREPEIVDLGRFLNSLGARIGGLGTSAIEIDGVDELGQPSGTVYRIISDRIEAATFLIAAAMTGGSVSISGIEPICVDAVLSILETAGVTITIRSGCISIRAPNHLQQISVVAQPYPGVPTDVQAQLTALACCVNGRSQITDEVFPGRWTHVPELARMGARIRLDGNRATVYGALDRRIASATVTANDLRGSAALILAGLAADGCTVVRRLAHLDRGYEYFEQKLTALGANVERFNASPQNLPLTKKTCSS